MESIQRAATALLFLPGLLLAVLATVLRLVFLVTLEFAWTTSKEWADECVVALNDGLKKLQAKRQ